MLSSQDCGPAALASVTGTPYNQILAKWPGGWRGGDNEGFGPLGCPNDTPYDHWELLTRLGIPWRIVTCGDILAGRAVNDKTMILLHSVENPLKAILAQHWVILSSIEPGGVRLHFGDGKEPRFMARSAFEKTYSMGWPACAYVVGEGKIGVTWGQRAIARLMGRWV